MNSEIWHDDEAALIAMQYALADVVELCRILSPASRIDANVIERIVGAASLQVMLLWKIQRGCPAAELPASLTTAA